MPLPLTWSNSSTHTNTRWADLTGLSHRCRNITVPPRNAPNCPLLPSVLPCLNIINPLLCCLAPPLAATPVFAAFLAWPHQSRAPPSTLPQGGVRWGGGEREFGKIWERQKQVDRADRKVTNTKEKKLKSGCFRTRTRYKMKSRMF